MRMNGQTIAEGARAEPQRGVQQGSWEPRARGADFSRGGLEGVGLCSHTPHQLSRELTSAILIETSPLLSHCDSPATLSSVSSRLVASRAVVRWASMMLAVAVWRDLCSCKSCAVSS